MIELLDKAYGSELREDLLNLLANQAYSKTNKQNFVSKEKSIESIINILGHYKTNSHEKAIASQFFVNLLHKFNAAISIINKDRFRDELRIVLDESERQIDRINLEMYANNSEDVELRKMLSFEIGDSNNRYTDNKDVEYVKILVVNLRKIISVISYA